MISITILHPSNKGIGRNMALRNRDRSQTGAGMISKN
jgi:hypothetical protein